MPGGYFDVGVAYWLINPDEKEYTAEYLCRKFLRRECEGVKKDTEALYKFAEKKLKEYKLEKLFYEVEMPLVEVLADMEEIGIKLDLGFLGKLDESIGKRLGGLIKLIYAKASAVFNINSPKQLSEILFQKLKIDAKGIKKTKSGIISTDVGILLIIRGRHPIVEYLLEYRELFKLQSTYIKPLKKFAGKNARIHTTYVQTGTTTGRLSSQNPNLQNIPAESEARIKRPAEGEWAKKLRKAFVAEKGYRFASFDYSQIELRILASLSGDPRMIEAFNNDLDIHKMTAANVFNIPIGKVTPEMRRLAKTLNFGVVYGMGAVAFAKTSGLSVAEARKFIAEYFNDFQKIKQWQEEIKIQARTFGYVTNLNSRRRWLLSAVSMFRGEAAEAERAAINMPVQGLAADIIKLAMIKIAVELKKRRWWGEKTRLLLTIHDELLFEIRDDIIEEAISLIKKLMEEAYELEVPIKVASKIGANWGALE